MWRWHGRISRFICISYRTEYSSKSLEPCQKVRRPQNTIWQRKLIDGSRGGTRGEQQDASCFCPGIASCRARGTLGQVSIAHCCVWKLAEIERSLVYADDLKSRLLNFIHSSISFSEAEVDFNVVSWNRSDLSCILLRSNSQSRTVTWSAWDRKDEFVPGIGTKTRHSNVGAVHTF